MSSDRLVLVEFLLIAGIVLALAVWQLVALHRDGRRPPNPDRRDEP